MRSAMALGTGLVLVMGSLSGCASSHHDDADHADHMGEDHAAMKASGSDNATIVTVGAVNSICPIGKEAVDTSLTSDHMGNKVAFCCAGCQEIFDGLEDERKSEFVELAMQGREMDFDE